MGGFLALVRGLTLAFYRGLVRFSRGLMECLGVLKEPTFVLRGSTWMLQRPAHWGVTLLGCYMGPAALTGANWVVTGTWWCVAGACGVLQGLNAFITEVLHKGAYEVWLRVIPLFTVTELNIFFNLQNKRPSQEYGNWDFNCGYGDEYWIVCMEMVPVKVDPFDEYVSSFGCVAFFFFYWTCVAFFGFYHF